MKLLRKSIGILLTLAILFGILAIIPIEAGAAAEISYVERSWDEANGAVIGTTMYRTGYTSIGSRSSNTLTGWYYADSTQTINDRLKVSGTVNLIIRDGKTLTLNKGIRVPEGNTLNIYGQQLDSGSLVAKANDYQAAIGSNDEDDDAENGAGNINIHGGTVKATGGDDSAGIGGGNEAHGGHITIYGGDVTAKGGEHGAGIGSGDEYEGGRRGSITIYGGTVNATGGDCGAGIGGGESVSGFTISILGGTVTGKGGEYGAGIGGGSRESSPGDIIISNATVNAPGGFHGAGIGGGAGGSSSKITITNATVNALYGYDGGAGIGGGYSGTNGNITITDSTVTVEPPEFNKGLNGTGAGIGAGFDRSQRGVITIERSNVYTETGNGAERGDGGGAGIGGGAYGSGGTINIIDSEVVACAYGGAGIGGGDAGTWLRSSGGNGGNITIQSSKVTAVSRCRGAGIGGGDEGNGGTVVIEDSEVIAAGGSSSYVPTLYKPLPSASPAEGMAYFLEAALLTSDCYGAGIGGGDGGDGANVTIENSTVTALVNKDEGALGIGWGNDGDNSGKLTLYNNLKVSKGKTEKQADGTYQFVVTETVPTDQRFSTCRREDCVQVSVCDHENFEWRWRFPDKHDKYCLNCAKEFIYEPEEHQWDSNYTCTVCGGTANLTNYSIVEQDDNGEIVQTTEYPYNTRYTLPECTHTPEGMSFIGWNREGYGDEIFLPGDTVYINYNDKFTAVYQRSYEVDYINKKGLPDTVYAKKLSESNGVMLSGWYYLDINLEMDDRLYFRGDVHLILRDGKTLSFPGYHTSDRPYSLYAYNADATLNIYGQTNQTGTIDSGDYVAAVECLHQYGGVLKGDREINTEYGMIHIQRGSFDFEFTLCRKLSIDGGDVDLGCFVGGEDGVTLGWSSPYDRITFGDTFHRPDRLGVFTVVEDQPLTDGSNTYEGTLTSAQIESLAGKTLTPDIPHVFNEPQWVWSNEYTQAKMILSCQDCDYVAEVAAAVDYEDSGQYRTAAARCAFNGSEYTTTQTFRVIFDVNIADCEHGTVTPNMTEARAGDRIKLDVTHDEGYLLDSLTVTDEDGHTVKCKGGSFNMPESEVAVTAVFTALDEVAYIDGDGSRQTAYAMPLSGNETELSSGWYYADHTVSFNSDIELFGDVKLILCDGAVMDTDFYHLGSYSEDSGTALTVFRAPGDTEGKLNAREIGAGTVELIGGQLDLSFRLKADMLDVSGGSLSAEMIDLKTQMELSGGTVEAYSPTNWVLFCLGSINISGGSLHVKSDSTLAVNCYVDFNISGGIVNIEGDVETGGEDGNLTISGGRLDVSGELRGDKIAITGGNVAVQGQMFSYGDIRLGWTEPTDSIKAAQYSTEQIIIDAGKPLTDGTTVYSGTYSYSDLEQFADKTLTPTVEQKIPQTDPYVDDNGAYILGTVEHYVSGGKNYAVNEDGSVGEELDSLALSFFDFTLINNDTQYQINYYTGPTDSLTELVIPKSYSGKPVTVIGNNINNSNDPNCRMVPQNTPGFTLVLNENITEIKPYSFYAVQIMGIEGDTSNLVKIGDFAFSWANSGGSYALDIRLDYPGKITVGRSIFNHMNVTARIKHATSFSRTYLETQSIVYNFTDAHHFGEPEWTWADGNSSAAAMFTCTDSRCAFEEIVNATVTGQTADGIVTYTATAVFDGNTYTDTKTAFADGIGANVIGHSISLDGDIGVSFYMELDDSIKNSETAYMQFTIPDTSQEYQAQTVYVKDVEPIEGGCYVFKCRVAAKDMTAAITAQIIDGDRQGTSYTYSVKDYADWLIEHKNDSEAYTKAAPLVDKMLRYGSYAKEYFDKTDTLDDLGAVEMDDSFAACTSTLTGDVFSGTTLSLKSQTTLSLYFTSGDDLTFTCVDKDGNERVVDTAKNGGYQVARIRNIAAKELQDYFTLTVKSGETVLGTITYSPMHYCYNALNGGTQDGKLINVVKALYQYSSEANEYFK